MGDIVNLTRNSVSKYKNQKHFRLDIQDRQFQLFKNRDINLKSLKWKHKEQINLFLILMEGYLKYGTIILKGLMKTQI